MTTVFVARFEARNWDAATRVFATREGALHWRDSIVFDHWHDNERRLSLGPVEARPFDRDEAAERLFEAIEGSFSVEECEVES
jgi:hypothetical protein